MGRYTPLQARAVSALAFIAEAIASRVLVGARAFANETLKRWSWNPAYQQLNKPAMRS